ncbi:M24 family metallopeptidase [Actinopolymorpha alba]|uniref:M24 family metallopeptidase n=1 Tax=Actinopolymorpha alba TaxID=533267 RepID=UPI0003691052|nr:Xaa-Pro peptidase family protein [Actinopolymorpha alba]
MSPAFPAEEFGSRVDRLQAVLRQEGVDVAVVHTPENVCYLSGHATPGYYTYQCLVVPATGEPAVLTRETETVNARATTHLQQIHGYPDALDPLGATVDLVRELVPDARIVGLEENSWFLPPVAHARLAAQLGGVKHDKPFALDGVLAELRVLKSDTEIAKIRAAATVTNAGMLAAVEAVQVGARERDIAAAAFAGLVSYGSEYFGMEPFVASGPRSGTIHASWTDRVVARDEPVLLEMAASRDRYHAPLMHTVWHGRLTGDLARMAEACAAARQATVEMVRPGATPAQAHETCRRVIGDHGMLHTYRKRSGYSVGIAFAPDWGEGHLLSLKETEHREFQPRMVVHVVPTLRLEGVGGIGFSATVLVTEQGNEILTTCPVGPVLGS